MDKDSAAVILMRSFCFAFAVFVSLFACISCKAQNSTENQAELLQIPVLEVNIDNARSPLMIAAAKTITSLHKCYTGEARNLIFPHLL